MTKLLRMWMLRWLLNSAPACTGGGCCTHCPHATLSEAWDSFMHNKLLPEGAKPCV